jgi:uncharacterized protein (DUF2062 family)
MPGKHFRKYLPTRESIGSNRFAAFFGSALHHHNLWHLNRRSVAGGVAAGLFCGLLPAPFQMLGAAICAVVLRVNLPVAVVATWYTNPFTMVPLYFLAYKLGAWVTGHTARAKPVPELDLEWSAPSEWIPALLSWMYAMGPPLVIGVLLMATVFAAVGYFAVLAAWRVYVALAWRRRQRNRGAQLNGGV